LPLSPPRLIHHDDAHGLWLCHGNCLELLDAIARKYPGGRFDMIFADPPYFLSNGGITCHAGRMVKVDKGAWDKSRGAEENHHFNLEWLGRCQRVLKPNGTLWVSGTHHVIFSIGYAMQQLGFKILNDIAWEKPNPPPNLSCRYFTHSTETILWAAKNEKSKHVFNYQEMRKVTGKQMKTVWRKDEFPDEPQRTQRTQKEKSSLSAISAISAVDSNSELHPVWTLSAPGNGEKTHGKHPTQKPVALVERCLLASTNPGDLVLDPFLGGGTTAVACIRLRRNFVGIELDLTHLALAANRADAEIITLWLRHFRVEIRVGTFSTNDLDLICRSMDRISQMSDKPEPHAERIFHETKFVFLSCALVSSASVVHTTVDVSLQEAWAKTPTGKKRETTHVVRCETEILRLSQAQT
jgi:site-specific DNA-methyltransferase (adenine-specific)